MNHAQPMTAGNPMVDRVTRTDLPETLTEGETPIVDPVEGETHTVRLAEAGTHSEELPGNHMVQTPGETMKAAGTHILPGAMMMDPPGATQMMALLLDMVSGAFVMASMGLPGYKMAFYE